MTATFANPVNLIVDSMDGELDHFGDFDSSDIRVATSGGDVSTLLGRAGFTHPFGITLSEMGDLYVETDWDDMGANNPDHRNDLEDRPGVSGVATVIVRDIGRPRGIVALPSGSLVLSDVADHTLRILDPVSTVITPLAGSSGNPGYLDDPVGSNARFDMPYGVALMTWTVPDPRRRSKQPSPPAGHPRWRGHHLCGHRRRRARRRASTLRRARPAPSCRRRRGQQRVHLRRRQPSHPNDRRVRHGVHRRRRRRRRLERRHPGANAEFFGQEGIGLLAERNHPVARRRRQWGRLLRPTLQSESGPSYCPDSFSSVALGERRDAVLGHRGSPATRPAVNAIADVLNALDATLGVFVPRDCVCARLPESISLPPSGTAEVVTATSARPGRAPLHRRRRQGRLDYRRARRSSKAHRRRSPAAVCDAVRRQRVDHRRPAGRRLAARSARIPSRALRHRPYQSANGAGGAERRPLRGRVRGEPGRVLRDADHDGKSEVMNVYTDGSRAAIRGELLSEVGSEWVYVANTDSVVRFPYVAGDTKARAGAEVVVDDIAGGGRLRGGGHWTRDVVFARDDTKMFVSVGSHSNVNDDASEARRARIFEYSPEGKEERVFATGIRNPVGLAVHPTTGELWTSVNERDELGDHLVPDYVTHVRGWWVLWLALVLSRQSSRPATSRRPPRARPDGRRARRSLAIPLRVARDDFLYRRRVSHPNIECPRSRPSTVRGIARAAPVTRSFGFRWSTGTRPVNMSTSWSASSRRRVTFGAAPSASPRPKTVRLFVSDDGGGVHLAGRRRRRPLTESTTGSSRRGARSPSSPASSR